MNFTTVLLVELEVQLWALDYWSVTLPVEFNFFGKKVAALRLTGV